MLTKHNIKREPHEKNPMPQDMKQEILDEDIGPLVIVEEEPLDENCGKEIEERDTCLPQKENSMPLSNIKQEILDEDIGPLIIVEEPLEENHGKKIEKNISMQYQENTIPQANIKQEILDEDIVKEKPLDENHRKEFEERDIYECEKCDAIFYNEKKRNKHLLSHVSEMPFQCGVCDDYFMFKTSLIQHLLTCHVGGKCSECNVCNRKFNGSQFSQHMMRHVKKTPYMCHLCNKMFWKRFALSKHLKDHPVSCHLCKKKFFKESLLTQHMKTHVATHVCNLCSKTFKELNCLKEHLLNHPEQIYHTCTMCDEVFEEVSALRNHTYIHIGKKALLARYMQSL